jgi:HlyD family type I secretion membrane fusion protein
MPNNLTTPSNITFGAGGEESVPERLTRRIQRTIWLGCAVGGVFIVGLSVWAAASPIAGSVSTTGVVKVEDNTKTVKHLEAGILRQILVHEGDSVRQGQLLFVFDDAQPRALVVQLQSAYDSLLAERARYQAEIGSRAAITFPPELLARRADPAVQAAISSQEALFAARRAALTSQMEIGRERAEEVSNQIVGLKAQVAAIDAQMSLNKEELGGVQTLYSGGYAPKTRLLALQRSAASLQGDRGEQVAAIARAQQNIGETRIQVLATQQAQISEAAAGLETAQDKMADTAARLAAAKDTLSHINVLAPVTGTVLNLTQFTEGGVVGAGEPLLDIVPTGAPLIIQAKVQPRDAHALRPGLKALVTLTAYNTRTTPRINAEVTTVSADQMIDPHTGKPYFTAELKIPADQLKRLPPEVKIYPGMPVSASIINGERTVLSYVLSPLHDALTQSMHEQ